MSGRYRVRVVGKPAYARALRDAQVDFFEDRGMAGYQRRQAAIAALPKVLWRGEVLHTIRCRGDFGRGPHDQNVPEMLLWHLISLERYLCPFHR